MPRIVVAQDRRSVLRRAIDEELLAQATDLAERVGQEPTGAWAPLPEQATLQDFKHAWFTAPILDLLRETEKLAAGDLTDDSKVGRQLRRRVNNVVLRAERVTEFVEFLRHLESEFVGLVRVAGMHAVVAVHSLLRSLTAEDDEDAAEGADEYQRLVDEAIAEDRLLLERLPYGGLADFDLAELTPPETMRILFGVTFDPSGNWARTTEALKERYDLYFLGQKQVFYLDPSPRRDPAFAEQYLRLAIRLSASQFPVLAHRAAYLTTKLSQRAAAADSSATTELVGRFYMDEAGWIIESDSTYRPAMYDFVENDNRPAILEALRAISEGVLRPYGSLLVALDRVAVGETADVVAIEPTLGALADRFSPLADPIFPLLRGFIKPELRNAEAHLRAAVGGAGQLLVRNDDGSTTAVNPNKVYGATTGLRSALDGVDVAVNLFFQREVVPTLGEGHAPRFISKEMVLLFARMSAEQYTQGSVTAVDAREGVLTVTFAGDLAGADFDGMLTHLLSAAPNFDTAMLVDEDGSPIARVTKVGDEPD